MIGDRQRGLTAENLISARAVRQKHFPSELFDEHAWNMLLHLFVSLVQNRIMSEGELLEKSQANLPVGRRWLEHLVADKQIEERQNGGEVIFTAIALQNMRNFLDEAGAVHSDTQPPS